MSKLPAPLTAPDCDLRGYEFMPLYGQRLFGSAFYTLALQNPRAGIAAQKLWWEAWQQCPAGSLPSDSATLCRLADFGSDMKSWRRCEQIALHGFILCSDGRMYHPLLCDAARDAYERRLRDRKRKAAQRAKFNADSTPQEPPPVPPQEEPVSHGTSDGQDAEVHVASDVRGQDRTGQDRDRKKERKVPPFSPPEGGAEKEALPEWMPSEWGEWETYRLAVGRKSWTPQVRRFSIASLDALRRDGHDPAAVIRQAIAGGFTAFRPLPRPNDKPAFNNGFAEVLHGMQQARGFIDAGEADEDDEPATFNRFLGGPGRAH